MSDVIEGVVGYMTPSKFDGGGFRIALKGSEGFLTLPENMSAGVQKGTNIKVKTIQKGKSVYVQAIKILGDAPPASGGYQAKGGGGNNGMSKEDWAAKDNAIRYQSARNAAIEYLKLQKDLEILKLGSKAAEKENVLAMKLDILTASFYNDIATLGAVERVESQANEGTESSPEDGDEFPDSDDEFPETADDDDF